jgi:hypothetical protein
MENDDTNNFQKETAALGRAVMSEFLSSARAYDIIPDSSKVVVFDTEVPVKLAFYALVEHGMFFSSYYLRLFPSFPCPDVSSQ